MTSVGLLLVTHGKLGHHLLETMQDMIGTLPLEADVLEVRRVLATDVLLLQGRRMIARLDRGAGVLLLTDAYGATPANIASRLSEMPNTAVVTGINLPMLVKIFNYPELDLAALSAAAVAGGQRGVIACPRPLVAAAGGEAGPMQERDAESTAREPGNGPKENKA